tara:strand:+ start:258 stop:587 length:330 start_codon:yes stop_codon:yes gene_type:complete
MSDIIYKIQSGGVFRDMNDVERAIKDEDAKRDADQKPILQLARIRKIRNQKLVESDYYALADHTLTDEMKTYRKNLRDITDNYDKSKYDELLARDENKQLTHSVWVKPS